MSDDIFDFDITEDMNEYTLSANESPIEDDLNEQGCYPLPPFSEGFTIPDPPAMPTPQISSMALDKIPERRARGTGVDAKPDPRDGYDYRRGYFYNEIHKRCGRIVNTFLWSIVKYINHQVTMPERLRRNEQRRIPVAYCHLDENRERITDAILDQAIDFAKSSSPRTRNERLERNSIH
jgi:hypothetical protein